ncbi:MAG: putative lipoprotein YmbA [Halioglobus sp.]|jgi:uncharacterized lipoprotein YmbA
MAAFKNRLLIVLCASILSACGSSPVSNYYLLNAMGTPNAGAQSPSLGIGPIEIPEYLNRNRLVYNLEGNLLHVASNERWAEPLTNGVARVIGLNLSSLLNTENVQGFPWYRSQKPDYGIQISVISLNANDTMANLTAEWVVQKPQAEKFLIRRISTFSQDLPAGTVTPAQIAPAYSKLLQQLSELIAATISADVAASSSHDQKLEH